MNKLPLNVWLLAICQALVMSVASLTIFVGGLVGTTLAPTPSLATLPVACMTVGTACLVIPVTMLMKKVGRKNGFLIILILSIFNAMLASYAVASAQFILFCISISIFGATAACVAQLRFAAIESVADDQAAIAASSVLLGGIAAAFIGPEVAVFGKGLLSTEFSGSFLLLAGLFALAIAALSFFKNPSEPTYSQSLVQKPAPIPAHSSSEKSTAAKESRANERALIDIARQPLFWVALLAAAVGYAVMSYVMTATPVSMHKMDGHSLQDTKWVIQSHIVAMFLPSLFTGYLIEKFGLLRLMAIGIAAYLVCIAIAFSGHLLSNYWFSLVQLGIGWNFLYIGGTTLLPRTYKPREKFKVQAAANDFFIFANQSIASLTAGWIVFSFGWETLLLIALPFVAILGLTLFKYRHHIPTK